MFDKYFAKLNEFRAERKYCDVNIVVGSQTFPCHRSVLASASSYFDAMFGGNFEESKQKEVRLNEIGAKCFENLLEFVYGGKAAIDEKNSYDLLTASRFFDIVDLEELCVGYMEENPPREHIFQTCTFASLTCKTKLLEKSLTYVAENFVELAKEEAFLEMPCDILEAVLRHSQLQRVDDVILDLVIRWKNNNSADKQQIRKLLTYVNPGGLTCDYLAKLVTKDDQVACLNVRVIGFGEMNYVIDAFKYRNCDQKWIKEDYTKANFYEKNVNIGNSLFTLSCLGWSVKAEAMNEFHVREREADGDYVVLKKPPIAVSNYALASVHGTVYLYKCRAEVAQQTIYETSTYAKVKDDEKSKQLFAYVSDLDEWFSVPQPKIETSFASVTSMNNLLYLVGGSYSEISCDFGVKGHAQCYDHRAPCWISLPSMSRDHINGAACSSDGKLYVLGGWSKEFEVFDPIAGRWQILKPSTYERTSHCLVAHEGFVWAIGNSVKLLPLEMYHANLNVWTESEGLRETVTGQRRAIDAFVW